jgi:hypothetical protein
MSTKKNITDEWQRVLANKQVQGVEPHFPVAEVIKLSDRKKTTQEQQPAQHDLTCRLTNDFLAPCGLYRGDRITIKTGAEVGNYELALVKADERHFIVYIYRRDDEGIDLYGPASLEPVLSDKAGECEVIGPALKRVSVVPLSRKQRYLPRQPAQVIQFKKRT